MRTHLSQIYIPVQRGKSSCISAQRRSNASRPCTFTPATLHSNPVSERLCGTIILFFSDPLLGFDFKRPGVRTWFYGVCVVTDVLFFFPVSDSFSFISRSTRGSPLFHRVRGHSRAFRACFKLPATCVWTQAAKASLGRQRRPSTPPQDLLPAPQRTMQKRLACFLSVLKRIFSGNNNLSILPCKHSEFTSCNRHRCFFLHLVFALLCV